MGTRAYTQQISTHPKWMSGRCAKCRWSDKWTRCCDYISLTGHARSRICPPGDACTVFELDKGEGHQTSGIPMPAEARNVKKLNFPVDQALALYREGRRDREIAEELGVSKQTIQRWRSLQGLHPNGQGGPVLSFREEDARRLHEKGLTDHEIGEKLGVSFTLIGRWRRRRGLKCNPRAKKEPETLELIRSSRETEDRTSFVRGHGGSIKDKLAYDLYRQGLSDNRIAKLIGATHTGVYNWRQRNGLPPNHPQSREKTGEEKCM